MGKPATSTPTEHQEQAAFVAWFRMAFPGVLIFATPNGAHLAGAAHQRARKMATLKAEGLVPGIPDLHVPEWRLWVEMKRRVGGRLSQEQRGQIAALEAIGHRVIVAKGWDDARAAVQSHRVGSGVVDVPFKGVVS